MKSKISKRRHIVWIIYIDNSANNPGPKNEWYNTINKHMKANGDKHEIPMA